MATTRSNTTDYRTDRFTAELAMRVPENDDGTLAESATQRLETHPNLTAVAVTTLLDLDPGLSATTAEFELRVETSREETAQTVREALAAAPGTETVERVEPD